MPKPKKGEDKKEYMGRCMGSDKMNKEFPDGSQRAAVCYSYWDESLKESMTFKDFLLNEGNRTNVRITLTKDGLGKKTYKLKYSGAPGYELSDLSGGKWYAKEFKKHGVNIIKAVGFKLKGDKNKINKIVQHLPNVEVEWT